MFPIITIATLLQFCAPSAKTASSSSYNEDLSIYRNDYSTTEVAPTEESAVVTNPTVTEVEDVEPTHDIHADLDSVTNIIIASRKDVNYVDGFTIQIYSGNSRDDANGYKSRAYDLLEDQKPRVIYDQPNYKVRVGKYYSKLEANRDYNTLKASFSRAVLIPDRIPLRD
ncbi:SPOR domain-containing protein [Reichenbachiella agarivorans]|uniref:SPOR domain-containing protein n=1 Tax=Reichenbachiella agarivorans TaxID=2979464 RepID=A0ABY6CRI3_9BACT|nr:SPOR domain-containing protein [Reichenbachiella agarivorans]UXP33122.1 SPOR domain-containing protein [Reichenbachiella agarivorans]